METSNKEKLVDLIKKEDVEYYSVDAINKYGNFEHFISTQNFEFEKICNILEWNPNKAVLIEDFDPGSEESSFIKELESRGHKTIKEDKFALITNLKRVPIVTRAKDCICVMIFDTDKKVVALALVTIKQTISKSLKNLVIDMNLKFNSNPMDLKVSVLALTDVKKPINNETDELLKNTFPNIGHCISYDHSGNTVVDLTKINIAILLEVGIKYENIDTIKSKTLNLNQHDNIYVGLCIK